MLSASEQLALYQQYYLRIVRYLIKKFNFTSTEAHDLAHEVFIRVFSRMDAPPIAPWKYLKTAAHNHAVNEIRARDIERRTGGIGSADAIANLHDILLRDFWTDKIPPSPEELTSGHEQSKLLHIAIEELPPSLKQCVLLRLGDLSYEQIAAALQITTDAVRTRLRDAKRLLQVRMREGR